MPRKSEQEWAIIENEYITMPVTYADLALKFKISQTALGTKAILRKWEVKRKYYLTKTCEKSQEQQIDNKAKEDFNLINTLEELIKQKTKAELTALSKYYKLVGEDISPKDLMTIVNKSKDSASELIKVVELLKGNATDRLDFQDQDKESEARNDRLNVLGFIGN